MSKQSATGEQQKQTHLCFSTYFVIKISYKHCYFKLNCCKRSHYKYCRSVEKKKVFCVLIFERFVYFCHLNEKHFSVKINKQNKQYFCYKIIKSNGKLLLMLSVAIKLFIECCYAQCNKALSPTRWHYQSQV